MHIKFKLAVLFIVVISLISCKPLVEDGLTYDEYVKKAKEYRNDSDYDRAIEAGKKAVNIKPNDSEAHYLLASLYYEGYRKAFDAARMKSLQNAILHPKKRQKSKSEIEEYKKYGLKAEWQTLAIQEFKETIKYDPNIWFARYLIATDYFNNKRFREAIDECKKVIATKPDYVNSYSVMGEAYYKLGEYNSAIQTLQTAIKIEPSSFYDYLNLGLAYKRTNNWKMYAEIATKLKAINAEFYNQLVNPES